ncbi:MAG: suppressor of fused domain protein [Huintestinicola sp.]
MGLKQVYFRIRGTVNRLTGKVAPTLHLEETEEHFNKIFGVESDDEHRVFHELMSDKVHVDIHMLMPTAKRRFYVLYTTGMSDLPMHLPDECPWDYKKIHEFGELFCLCPEDWDFSPGKKGETRDELKRRMWPIECLKSAARFPHVCSTWLGNAHTIQYTEECMPFSDNTKLCSGIFIHLDYKDIEGRFGDDLEGFYAKDGSYINLLCFIPLYIEELMFKLSNEDENSGIRLFKRLFGDTVSDFSQLVIDTERENVCRKSDGTKKGSLVDAVI